MRWLARKQKRKQLVLGLQLIGFVTIFTVALAAAGHIARNAALQSLVSDFGLGGILIVSYLSGLNLVIPIHVTVFVPVFTAAGFPLVSVIFFMVLGTILADLTGYAIGYYSKRFIDPKENPWYVRMQDLVENKTHWVLPFVFLYATFAPLPNELIVIPLALLGIRLRILLIPLILGTILHVVLLALGINNLFGYIFMA